MFHPDAALDFVDWGNANLAANRACIARARAVLRDAAERLRRHAPAQGLVYQWESSPVICEGSDQTVQVFSSRYGCAGPLFCEAASQMPVPTLTAAIIASAYEIDDTEQVQLDARELNGWSLPLDDFATRLGTVHRWKAETVAVYIGALRSALLDRHGPTPWDDL